MNANMQLSENDAGKLTPPPRPGKGKSQDSYNVAGIVVHTLPENCDALTDRLNQLEGVEVHGANTEEGKLVVTIEELPGQKLIVNQISTISETKDVLNTSLIFSQTDCEAAEIQDPEEHQ